MAFIRAFGSYVPARVVANAELAERLGCDAEWILNVSGISERRYASDAESVAGMGVRAAQDCLSRAGGGQIGMVIVSSGSSERRFPGPAAEIAAKLGLAGVPAIDLPMASAGSLFGLAMAGHFAGSCGPVLLVAAEKMSSTVSIDKNTAILFGDGAGACFIDPNEGVAELVQWCLHSDGNFTDALRLDFGQDLHMDGGTVIMHAARKVPAVIRELLDRTQQSAPAIGTFLMHQANQNLILKIARTLEVAPEKFFSNIGMYGNTSSASMLIAAAEWNAQSGFRRGEPVIFAGFGAGFHWGSLLAIGS
ncbi:MAG TPA: ketoacyl-ACP synthase III [Bryobacteraceae bacterium]|nr:ketoacyl-ACP synthase III [Bryobacteraceae bacterium]